MKRFALFASLVIFTLLSAVPVFGHGVFVRGVVDPVTGDVRVIAEFDTNEPFSEAQVSIFAPNDLINPWGSGVTDADGVFVFTPDYAIEGFWEIQVRAAGHGGTFNLEISADMAPDPDAQVTVEATAEAESASAGDASEADTTGVTSLTIGEGTQIVISGNAEFVVSGDVVISAAGAVVENTAASAPATADVTSGTAGSDFTPTQVAIMSVSVIWGFIGTALYFSSRRRK